jgi:hypothetical protein
MKIIKGRSLTVSPVNDEKRQVIPSQVIWGRDLESFKLFRNNVEDYYRQIGAGYLIDLEFQDTYLQKGANFNFGVLDEMT